MVTGLNKLTSEQTLACTCRHLLKQFCATVLSVHLLVLSVCLFRSCVLTDVLLVVCALSFVSVVLGDLVFGYYFAFEWLEQSSCF